MSAAAVAAKCRLFTTVVPNISKHMLEEGAPCRDLLLASNMTACGMGSLVLCVQAGSPVPAGASGGGTGGTGAFGAGTRAASAPEGVQQQPSCGGGGGGGVGGPGGATSAALVHLALPSLSALSQPLSVLHSQRQFGMYLLFSEALPAGVLQSVAAELKMLLGMALSACCEGPLSVLDGGRCAIELYALQERMLGLATGPSSGPGGTAPLASALAAAAAAAAAASAAALPLASSAYGNTGAGPLGGLVGSGTVSSPIGIGLRAGILGRRAAQGIPLPRSLFAAAAASCGIRSAGSPRLQPFQMQQLITSQLSGCSATSGGRALPTSGLLPSAVAAARGSGVDRETLDEFGDGVGAVTCGAPSGEHSALRLMMASSPEVLLEAPAAGPSPLEVMVSSMRTGLTAALTNAMMMDSTDEAARNAMSQELAAIRLYDVIGKGGQGVVFYGTLHGLETAVKVIVHRGRGEPLAHDAGEGGGGGGGAEGADGSEGGGGGGAAEDGGQEGEEGGGGGDLSRIRKAKRGAMELVVTGTLSHPNIVQVLASFSDVIMVRCTYRNEPTPRLLLVAKDDPILASWATPGPLNTVVCLEYCDAGTLLEAAHSGAFRPAGSSVLTGAVRPALVPLYTSLLEIALALRYLHSRRLVHCDLKPANVLLKSSNRDPRGWNCKLSDFGCVRLTTDLPATPTTCSGCSCSGLLTSSTTRTSTRTSTQGPSP